MEIRATGMATHRRRGSGQGAPALPGVVPVSNSTAQQRTLPPPVPVTTEMLPSWKAARSAELGAKLGYASAKDVMKDD